MVDKPAHSASAAHMSAVKAMGFADWFPQSVRKQEFVQEVSARAGAPERVCMNRFLMPLCLRHFSSEKTLMVLETNELEYCIRITISILPGPWTIQWPWSFSTEHRGSRPLTLYHDTGPVWLTCSLKMILYWTLWSRDETEHPLKTSHRPIQ